MRVRSLTRAASCGCVRTTSKKTMTKSSRRNLDLESAGGKSFVHQRLRKVVLTTTKEGNRIKAHFEMIFVKEAIVCVREKNAQYEQSSS